jgi:integrase
VDLEKRVLKVGKSKTENGTDRPIPLTQPAWAALELWASRFSDRQPEHFVFPSCENGKIDLAQPVSHWRTAWSRACKDAGLPGLGFHSLRHSAVTKLLENGVPFAVVAQIAGWAPSTAVRMAKRYGHIRPEIQRAALDKIATDEILPRPKIARGGDNIGYSRSDVLTSVLRN